MEKIKKKYLRVLKILRKQKRLWILKWIKGKGLSVEEGLRRLNLTKL